MALEHRIILAKVDDSNMLTDIAFYTDILDNSLQKNCSILLEMCVADSIVAYFADYLSWVPAKNYQDKSYTYGINRCGITIYDYESKDKLAAILNSIRSLFENAPNSITLHGEPYSKDDTAIYIEEIKVDKELFLKAIDQIIVSVSKLNESGYYLVHLGV